MRRIVILGLSLVLSAAAAVAQGRAGDFPSQPLRLIIGFPPGSAADITARLVGAHMSETLGQQLVIESRTGAGSGIARSSSRARRRTAIPCTSVRPRT